MLIVLIKWRFSTSSPVWLCVLSSFDIIHLDHFKSTWCIRCMQQREQWTVKKRRKTALDKDRKKFRTFSMSKHLFRILSVVGFVFIIFFFLFLLSLSYWFPIFTAVSVHRLHIDNNNTEAFVTFRFSYLQSIRSEFSVGFESVCDHFVCAINETVSISVACLLFVFKCVQTVLFPSTVWCSFLPFLIHTLCVIVYATRKETKIIFNIYNSSYEIFRPNYRTIND